ncbi:MAG: FAD-binding oxidoreductase [Azospirillum sp.]|nr:FAD-binding oxidoreductase [Azospirillum sp.]MCZ8123115.1 FAD-binding oxidoreductase [Magnetospirillum sp.]
MTAEFDRLRALLGPKGWLETDADIAPYEKEERGLFKGKAAAVARPADTNEVAEVLKICNAARIGVVPQSGNTGLVGGGVPDASGRQIVLSLARLDRVRGLDAANDTISVEAGVILADIQKRAAEAGRLFPLSLAAEGTCRIGGNLSTNAGGINVLRYGMARDLVLGLEVVLADGRVLDAMKGLRKDNTGYDLKQIFLGAEGTLGIVTAAVLKLFPAPREIETCLVAVPDPKAAIELLGRAKNESGGNVQAFELTQRRLIDYVLAHIPGTSDPLAERHDWYVLIEFASGDLGGALKTMVERLLERAMEDGLVLDAAIASSEQQRKALWKLRESMTEAQKPEGASIKHDVSVPVSSVPEFLAEATALCEAMVPGARVCAFGHAGDGNIHFNISRPTDWRDADFQARRKEMNAAVHGIVGRMRGSISAEHGVGILKRDDLPKYKDPTAIELMRTLKAAFDPNNILNPGKVVP